MGYLMFPSMRHHMFESSPLLVCAADREFDLLSVFLVCHHTQ